MLSLKDLYHLIIYIKDELTEPSHHIINVIHYNTFDFALSYIQFQ